MYFIEKIGHLYSNNEFINLLLFTQIFSFFSLFEIEKKKCLFFLQTLIPQMPSCHLRTHFKELSPWVFMFLHNTNRDTGRIYSIFYQMWSFVNLLNISFSHLKTYRHLPSMTALRIVKEKSLNRELGTQTAFNKYCFLSRPL